MGSNRKVFFAVFSVFLLLSAHPVESVRVHSAGVDVRESVRGKSEWGTVSCERLQERFNGRVAQQQARVRPDLGFAGSTSLLLQTWSMIRVLRRASERECEWAVGQGFDTSGLAGLTNATLASNPCLGDAQAILRSAEDLEEPAKSNAFLDAMQVLLTPPGEVCRTVTEAEFDAEEDVEDVGAQEEALLEDPDGALVTLEADADEVAETLTEVALAVGDEGSSLVQIVQDPATQTAAASGVSAVLAPVGELASAVYGFSVANAPVSPVAGASVAEYLSFGVGVVAWMLIFTLACTVAVHIVTWVLGAVLCMLRWFFNILIMRPLHGALPVCMFKWSRHVQGSRLFRTAAVGTCAGFGAAPLLAPLVR